MNVAARLQAECPPGGICVSRSVRDHVHGRLDLAFEELGALNLKNIARPVEAFVLRLDGAATMPRSVERSLVHDTGEALPLPDKPSIAVLAFTNMSGDLTRSISPMASLTTSSPNCRAAARCSSSPATPASPTRDVQLT